MLDDLSETSTEDSSEKSTDDLDTGLEPEDDELEKCKILKHKNCKDGEVKVEVKWELIGNKEWLNLYDMWADYPGEVEEYKKKNQNKCKGKLWKVPNLANVKYFVRILGMHGGDEKPEDAEFIVLANNGYKFDDKDCVKYDDLQNDAPELLEAFLQTLEA
jgi:hypothetical protein